MSDRLRRTNDASSHRQRAPYDALRGQGRETYTASSGGRTGDRQLQVPNESPVDYAIRLQSSIQYEQTNPSAGSQKRIRELSQQQADIHRGMLGVRRDDVPDHTQIIESAAEYLKQVSQYIRDEKTNPSEGSSERIRFAEGQKEIFNGYFHQWLRSR